MMNKQAKLTNLTKAPMRVPGLRLYVPAGSSITLTAFQTDRMLRSRTDRRELQAMAALGQLQLEILATENPAEQPDADTPSHFIPVSQTSAPQDRIVGDGPPVLEESPEEHPVLDGNPPVLVEPPILIESPAEVEPEAPEISEPDVPAEPQAEPQTPEPSVDTTPEIATPEVPAVDPANKGRRGRGRKSAKTNDA